MTDKQREQKIRALLEERRGYEVNGNKERVEQVDEELRKLGAAGATPVRRATRRAERG